MAKMDLLCGGDFAAGTVCRPRLQSRARELMPAGSVLPLGLLHAGQPAEEQQSLGKLIKEPSAKGGGQRI